MKYLSIITAFFVATLLMSNTVATKLFSFGPFIFTGAILLFPIAYIFGDILTEVYGYRESRKVIWIGFFALLCMAIIYFIIGLLPSAPGWENQGAYIAILGVVPRVVFASIVGYFAGEFANSFILAKMKLKTKGKHLWMRTIGSTIVGEGVDTVLFAVIAFYGIIPNNILLIAIISGYLFKVVYEVLITPVTYIIVNYLKKQEKLDVYDSHTDFNPLSLK